MELLKLEGAFSTVRIASDCRDVNRIGEQIITTLRHSVNHYKLFVRNDSFSVKRLNLSGIFRTSPYFLPVFSDGDAAKVLYASLARRGKSLATGKAILASQYVPVSSESDLRE
jgi:hypothetical protein